MELLVDRTIFGHRFITLSKLSGQHEAAGAVEPGVPRISGEPPVRDHPIVPAAVAAPAPPPAPVPAPAPAAAAPLPPRSEARAHLPRLATLVLDARAIASRIIVAPAAGAALVKAN